MGKRCSRDLLINADTRRALRRHAHTHPRWWHKQNGLHFPDQNSWCGICPTSHDRTVLCALQQLLFIGSPGMSTSFCLCVIKNANRPLVSRLVSCAPFSHVVHLLNVVHPVDRIVYFLPTWWKFCKKRDKVVKMNGSNGGMAVRMVEEGQQR